MPVIKAIVPPETPGTTSAAPMAAPLMYNINALFMLDSAECSNHRSINQRHEAHGVQQMPGKTVFLTNDQHQLLNLTHPDRYHQTPAWRQLIEQSLRHVRCSRAGDDAVVRRQCRPASPAIATAKDHIAQLQFGKTLLGTFLQRLDSLDREHPLHQLRQYGGLVTGAGADLQHLVQRARG